MVQEFAKRRGRQDIPFGVRAIESGIEVEGVWISRNNSPAPSTLASPLPSPSAPPSKGKTTVRSSEIPSLTMPEPVHPYPESRSAASSTGSFERAVEAERLASGSNSPEPTAEARTPRPSYKPRQPSALRFSTADDLEIESQGMFIIKFFSLFFFNNFSGRQYNRSSSGSSSEEQPTYYHPKRGDSDHSGVPRTRTPVDMLPFTQHSTVASPISLTSPSNQRGSFGPEDASFRRFHYPNKSNGSITDSYQSPIHTPSGLAHVESSAPNSRAQSRPLIESIELTENRMSSATLENPAGKRQSRKLRKKNPSIG
jgi:hypothetical protein